MQVSHNRLIWAQICQSSTLPPLISNMMKVRGSHRVKPQLMSTMGMKELPGQLVLAMAAGSEAHCIHKGIRL